VNEFIDLLATIAMVLLMSFVSEVYLRTSEPFMTALLIVILTRLIILRWEKRP